MPDLQDRTKFEADLSARFQKLSAKHKRELMSALGKPPSIDNIPADFWFRVEQDRKRETQESFLLLYLLIAANNGSNTGLAKIHADTYATQRATELSRRYAINSRDRVSQVLSTVPQTAARSEIGAALDKVFSPSRDTGTAVTEITRIDTSTRELSGAGKPIGTDGASTGAGPGGLAMARATTVWVTMCDPTVCNCCWPLHKIPVAIHNLRPPLHPNCRCYPESDMDRIRQLDDDCPRPTTGDCSAPEAQRAIYLAARKLLWASLGVTA